MVGCRSAGDAPKAGNSCCSTTCLMIAFMSRVSDTHFASSPPSPHCESIPLSCVGLLALCASCLSEASGKPPESPPLLILSRVSDTHFSSSSPSPHCENSPLSCVGLLALCASYLSEASGKPPESPPCSQDRLSGSPCTYYLFLCRVPSGRWGRGGVGTALRLRLVRCY